jgi:hypothetical protein
LALCVGIALAGSELPTELIGRYRLQSRLYVRGGQPEYRFLYRERRPRLPVLRDGVVTLARWGNGCRTSRVLPRTGWTWKTSVDAGYWARSGAVPVVIPATYGLERRGVWFGIRTGIRGLLVPDEHGCAVCYMLCEEPTHYYRVMTGARWMPILVDQVI